MLRRTKFSETQVVEGQEAIKEIDFHGSPNCRDYHHGGAFARIPSRQQLELHDYFAIMNPLDQPDFLAHRLTISREQPSLPQRAGRAHAQIEPFLERTMEPNHATMRGGHVVARAIRRPNLDTAELARILVKSSKADAKKRSKG